MDSYASCARWIGGRKTVACDLPCIVYLLKQEELLVGLRATRASRVDLCCAGRVGTREHPVRRDLADFGDLELNAERNCDEDGLLSMANDTGTDAGRAVLGHEHSI